MTSAEMFETYYYYTIQASVHMLKLLGVIPCTRSCKEKDHLIHHSQKTRFQRLVGDCMKKGADALRQAT